METFTGPRRFVQNTRYCRDRQDALAALDLSSIDGPLVDIVSGFAALPHCYTLQCCFGHFLRTPAQDLHSLEPVPQGHAGAVRYRIAYMAFCLDSNQRGRHLWSCLARVPEIDPAYVQFGSAD
ncbi:hypothetical protein ACFL6X_03365 [Candidatus Latescibacterota bacterium]